MSTTPSTSPKVLTLDDLLAAHHDDPHSALSALVTRHNELAQHHSTLLLRASALQLEKDAAVKAAERMGVENHQLWRSLKAMGTAAGGSPRPATTSRHNSDSVSGRDGGKSLGATGEKLTGSSPPVTLRRGLSTEGAAPRDQLDAPPTPSPFSTPSRTPAETPPVTSSSRFPSRAASHASLRTAGSLDLGRAQPEEPGASTPGEIPRTPPPPSTQGEENGTARLPYSASMPTIAPHTPDRRLVPQLSPLAPVSPLYAQHPQDTLSPVSAHDQASLFSAPSPTYTYPDQQLHPPHSSDAIRRNRTPSNTSTSSSAGISPAPIPGPPTSAIPTAPSSLTPSSSSAYSSPPPQDSKPSTHEQRRDPPPTLSSPLIDVPPLHSSHAPRQHFNESEPFYSSQSQKQPARTGLPDASPRPTFSPVFLPFTSVRVASSTIRMNERSKEVISFLIDIVVNVPPEADPERYGGTARWRVEKSYSDVLGLDAAIKAKTSKQEIKGIGSLPDKSLFKDHAPHKSDQRKAVLERYLQTVITIPLRDRSSVCSFFNTDVVQEAPPPPASSGSMEGWLTKRGRNFGGWQKRYYVLAHGALSYYDARGGSKFGEINIAHAAIGRQSSQNAVAGDDAYLHAFLIRTSKKDDKEQEADHILCAENDEERDGWVVALTSVQSAKGPQRSTGSSSFDRERISAGDPAVDGLLSSHRRERSFGSVPSNLPEVDSRFLAKRSASTDLPPSASLPNSLDAMARSASDQGKRSASELGQYADLRERSSSKLQPTRRDDERHHKLSFDAERPPTPDRRGDAPPPPKLLASNVSGPMNAAPLPTGYEFKKADRRKTKSFWNFAGRGAGGAGDKQVQLTAQSPLRPVFGVPLKEAVAISRIRPGLELPALVYRCVEFLEAKNAESEEGIFRLSGSANVIRALKDRFNAEGDFNLLASHEFYDTHAIAGLLKTYLRELPVHLLTRELHPEFIQVIDLRGRKDRVNALGRLVARLPIEEYTLFRFFFAHLCVIAQNAEVSKMGLRNLGIVFSPTLAIPAPLFSLLLAEFDLVFAVEKSTGLSRPIMVEDQEADLTLATATTQPSANRPRPNSAVYADSGLANLMEHEGMGRLNEQADEEDSAASDSAAEAALEDYAEEDDVPSSYLAFPSTPGPPPVDSNVPTPRTPTPTLHPMSSLSGPRSPGLPASPRPGATFASSSSPH